MAPAQPHTPQLAASGAIDRVFSLCFGFPSGGALLLGDVAPPSGVTLSYTPLLPSATPYYVVRLEAISIGGEPLRIEPVGTLFAQLCTGWRSRPLLRMLMAHLLQPRYRQVTLFGHTPTLNCTRTPQLCAPPAGNLCQGLWDSV